MQMFGSKCTCRPLCASLYCTTLFKLHATDMVYMHDFSDSQYRYLDRLYMHVFDELAVGYLRLHDFSLISFKHSFASFKKDSRLRTFIRAR